MLPKFNDQPAQQKKKGFRTLGRKLGQRRVSSASGGLLIPTVFGYITCICGSRLLLYAGYVHFVFKAIEALALESIFVSSLWVCGFDTYTCVGMDIW